MFKVLHLMVSTVLVGASFTVQASDKACLLEGSFSLMGQRIVIKDCMQNGGMPQDQFMQSCQGSSQAAAAMGGAPAKITYLAACPAAAKGVCEKLLGGPLTGFCYSGDTQTLQDTEASCKAGGGTRKKG